MLLNGHVSSTHNAQLLMKLNDHDSKQTRFNGR